MRDYLALKANVNSRREFYLLWVLGQDLPGAITVLPSDGEPFPPARDAKDKEHFDYDSVMRFSLAGVQLKFSAVMKAKGGLTIPAKGIGGSWIVKLPSPKYEGVPENEFAMMTLAGAVGIDVPEVRLLDMAQIRGLPKEMSQDGRKAFAIRRFDRGGTSDRIHTEDFAQVFGVYPEDKYAKASYRNLAAVIQVEAGESAIEEFIRRLVFNALIGNGDMHLKNWSLIYPNRRDAQLAPAYDFVSTIVYIPEDRMGLNVSRTKEFSEFSLDELAHMAVKAGLPQQLVRDTANATLELFDQEWKKKAGFDLPQKVIKAIDDHLKKVPLASGK